MSKSGSHDFECCGKCGAALNGYGPEGLCAACLLESAFDEQPVGEMSDDAPAPLLAFDDYELLEEIARGGMGVVYRARQISLNRPVAVKMILGGHLANAAGMRRFRAEAETAAQLQHPRIVAIHEVGQHDGQPFFSMDLVEGRNLAQLVRDEPLPVRKAAAYLKTIAEAVHYAHSRGVLHRDLKPSNILIDESDQPRITDFGLAKRLTDPQLSGDDPQLTQTGQVLGSPSFIPPEQAAGRNSAVGPASDVYSLGAILYHCLTGRPPFVAETLTQTLRLVAEQEPVSPRLLNASVPRDLETICLKCLEKDPGRRYTTAQALADDVNRFFNNEPIHARPVGNVLKAHRWCVRNKPLAISGTAILALLLVVAIGSPIAAIRIDRERKRAETEAARTRQVSRVLQDMLRSAGPSVARGRDATLFREILERTSERMGHQIQGQPEVQGDIFRIVAQTFMDMGDHRRAITNFEQAVASYRLAFRGDHRNLAITLSDLGFCQSFTDDVARGSNNARLGMEMARRSGDPKLLSSCLLRYATSLRGWGMFRAESEPYVREAFELQKQIGDDPAGLAFAMHMYSGFVTNEDQGEQMMRDSLSLYRKHLPPGDPKTIQGVFSLGQRLVSSGKYEAAEEVMTEAFHGFQKTHGPNHPYQAIVLRFLAEALLQQGKGEEAESLVRKQLSATPNHGGYKDLLSRVTGFRRAYAFDGEILKHMTGDFLMQDWLLAENVQSAGDEPQKAALLHARPPDLWQVYGRAGKWEEAVAGLRRSIEADPERHLPYMRLAAVLLFTGEEGGYRQLCQQMLARFSGTRDSGTADNIAKACAIHPRSGVDLSAVAEAAETAVTLGKESEYRAWFALCKSLAEYRLGRFAAAVEWGKNTLVSAGQIAERDAAAYLVLAMAQKQLQQDKAARVSQARGTEIIEQKLPKLDSGDLGAQWVDRIIVDILQREAKAVIGQM